MKSQETEFLKSFSYWPVPNKRSGNNIYDVRSYRVRPGSMVGFFFSPKNRYLKIMYFSMIGVTIGPKEFNVAKASGMTFHMLDFSPS